MSTNIINITNYETVSFDHEDDRYSFLAAVSETMRPVLRDDPTLYVAFLHELSFWLDVPTGAVADLDAVVGIVGDDAVKARAVFDARHQTVKTATRRCEEAAVPVVDFVGAQRWVVDDFLSTDTEALLASKSPDYLALVRAEGSRRAIQRAFDEVVGWASR